MLHFGLPKYFRKPGRAVIVRTSWSLLQKSDWCQGTTGSQGFSPDCRKRPISEADFGVCVRTHACANLLTCYRREAALTRCF